MRQPSKSSLSQWHVQSEHLAYRTAPSSATATKVPLFACTLITPLHAKQGQKRARETWAMFSLLMPCTYLESMPCMASRQCMVVLMSYPPLLPVILAIADCTHSGRNVDFGEPP